MSTEKEFSIFTKPWKNVSASELGKIVSDLGFRGIEFPLREGYQADLNNAKNSMKYLSKTLAGFNVCITSVASSTEEKIFEACAESGVPLIRIMYNVDPVCGYMASEAKWKKDIERFLPLCDRYKVKVGIQQHYGSMVNNTMEMRNLVEDYNPELVGGVWDAAHSGLADEEPEQALDIIWDHLVLVNFKSAFFKLESGPEAHEAEYERFFTTGRHGLCSWRRAVQYLCSHGYDKNICLPAEYTDEAKTEIYAAEDLAYIKELFAECSK